LDNLLQPDLFVIGGGVSKRADEFMHYMTVKTPIKMASLMNEAGIVGAALTASQHVSPDVLKKGIKL
jgi:polyphosphate glucokinase